MTTTRISERTEIEDVLSWQLSSASAVRMSRSTSFEPGAQGLAVAALAAIDHKTTDLTLACDFPEPDSIESLDSTPFASAFGFSVSRLARRIEFAGTQASPAFKSRLSDLYRARDGILGLGSSRSLVSPDPVYPVPPVLGELSQEAVDSFPAPSTFQSVLKGLAQSMGFARLLRSAEESSVVDFVYEALRNSLEHGVPSDIARRRRSTRALTIEKVVLGRADVANRHLSIELKTYLERVVEANPNELGLGVVCITVADQGDGIQATLPARPGEEARDRLARAFEAGESRKPAGIVSRGLGLPKVVSSAHGLQALIRVTSGNLQIGQDFSFGDSRYPKLDFSKTRDMPHHAKFGTCVSIFFPEFGFDVDQKPLFGR